jgi:hypothetical protein
MIRPSGINVLAIHKDDACLGRVVSLGPKASREQHGLQVESTGALDF